MSHNDLVFVNTLTYCNDSEVWRGKKNSLYCFLILLDLNITRLPNYTNGAPISPEYISKILMLPPTADFWE